MMVTGRVGEVRGLAVGGDEEVALGIVEFDHDQDTKVAFQIGVDRPPGNL